MEHAGLYPEKKLFVLVLFEPVKSSGRIYPDAPGFVRNRPAIVVECVGEYILGIDNFAGLGVVAHEKLGRAHDCRCFIAVNLEDLRKGSPGDIVFRDFKGEHAVGAWILAGNDAHVGYRGQIGVGDGVFEEDRLLRETVDVRAGRALVAIRSEVVGAEDVNGDHDHIGVFMPRHLNCCGGEFPPRRRSHCQQEQGNGQRCLK